MGKKILNLKIKISDQNLLALKEKSLSLGFKKIENYMEYIVEQLVSENSVAEEADGEDEAVIKKKLKELGYL